MHSRTYRTHAHTVLLSMCTCINEVIDFLLCDVLIGWRGSGAS